jgi:hypothetical protein
VFDLGSDIWSARDNIPCAETETAICFLVLGCVRRFRALVLVIKVILVSGCVCLELIPYLELGYTGT